MGNPLIITLDGPMGSGKTSLGRALAKRLSLPFLSTGLLYRAVGYLVRSHNLPIEEERILSALKITPLSLLREGGEFRILLGGTIIPEGILKEEEIAELASMTSQFAGIRRYLLPIQRSAVTPEGLVAEGRDLGSVVFPEATLKLYLSADPEVRLKRRAQELGRDYQEIKRVSRRDERDSRRSLAPLLVPEGAKILDTTSRTVEELVEIVLDYLDTVKSPSQNP
jgi:cytidylate kinase